MTTTRDGATTSASPADVGEASAFPGVRGLRWWAVLLLALVLTAGGVAADVLRSGTLGVVFLAAYPGGCVLAAVLAQRRDIFVPMVQPPLLLAVSVPVAVAATGSLPTSGGLVSTALAIGAPLINGFPAMAVTTVVCVLIGFVRTRVQRWHPPEVEERREPVRSGPAATGRPRDGRARDDRDRREAGARDRVRERGRDPRDPRDDRRDDRRDRDRAEAAERREQADRERRRAQERARAERDREMLERDRAKRERREQQLAERERARRERPATKRPKDRGEDRRDDRADERGRPEGDRERLARGAAEVPPGPTPQRSPLKGAGRDESPPAREKTPPRDQPPPARDARSREERMREERLREERRGDGRPPGVHPVRERPPERPPR